MPRFPWGFCIAWKPSAWPFLFLILDFIFAYDFLLPPTFQSCCNSLLPLFCNPTETACPSQTHPWLPESRPIKHVSHMWILHRKLKNERCARLCLSRHLSRMWLYPYRHGVPTARFSGPRGGLWLVEYLRTTKFFPVKPHSSYFGSKIKKITCIFDELKKSRLYILNLDHLGLHSQGNQINDFLHF